MGKHPFFRNCILVFSCLVIVGVMVATLFIAVARADEEIIVNINGDGSDASPGNGTCATASGVCTLRAAIEEANALTGGQTIRFSEAMIISPLSQLPALTDDYTVIDGSDRWTLSGDALIPGVILSGFYLSGSENGLVINASHCAVYGIQVVTFPGNGIYMSGVAQNNQIGSEDANQRNIISNNDDNGVKISGVDAINNTISGNYIGTTSKGLYANIGNAHHGISAWYGNGNVITGNLIADNNWSGIAVDDADAIHITKNRIGMNVLGEPLPNGYYGLHIAHNADTTIAYNDIAFNKRGILLESGSYGWIGWNKIYENGSTSLPVPDGGGVLITGTGTIANLVKNDILGNAALYGGGVAVEDGANGMINQNTIQENESMRSDTGELGGGGIYIDNSYGDISNNLILSNTVSGESGPTNKGYSDGGGILLNNTISVMVADNEIRGNTVTGFTGNGGGIYILNGSGDIHINKNLIIENSLSGVESGGGGIGVFSTYPDTRIWIDANRIENNSGNNSGAIWLHLSDYVTMTNNIITNNLGSGVSIFSCGTNIQSNFNTIVKNSGSGFLLNNANVFLYNTLVISNTGYGVELSGGWGLSPAHNDVWGNGSGASNIGAHFYLEADPLFFNAEDRVFALRFESPCLDGGDSDHPVSNSFNGVARPAGSGYDLGAIEMRLPTVLPVILR